MKQSPGNSNQRNDDDGSAKENAVPYLQMAPFVIEQSLPSQLHTEDEQAELARLKHEAESRGETLDAITIRRLKLKAVANVAAHKFVKPNNQ